MLTELVDTSCVKLIDGTALFRWTMKSVKESISPFHIKKMSSMNRTQITRQLNHSGLYTKFHSLHLSISTPTESKLFAFTYCLRHQLSQVLTFYLQLCFFSCPKCKAKQSRLFLLHFQYSFKQFRTPNNFVGLYY